MIRVWMLLGFDPATGCATTVVAVAGTGTDIATDSAVPLGAETVEAVSGDAVEALSWVPLEHQAATRWQTILASRRAGLDHTLEYWADAADGVLLDAVELTDIPTAGDVRSAVEMVMDSVLAPAGWER